MTAKPKKKFALPKTGGKLSKKAIAIGSACIAVILVVAIVLGTVLLRGRGAPNYALYIKDGGLTYLNPTKDEPWLVTDQLFSVDLGDLITDWDDYSEITWDFLSFFIQSSKDGKTLFYPEDIDEDAGFTLSCCRVNSEPSQATRIDTQVVYYMLNDDGSLVTYLKGEESALYQHNLTEKTKLASGVEWFAASADGEMVYYCNEDNELFLKSTDGEAEKLDSDVQSISNINEAFDTIYYIKDDQLYKKVLGSEKIKIASDVANVLQVYETGELYYVKAPEYSDELSLADFVEDDLYTSDAAITEPEYPDFFAYESMEAYDAAYDAYREAYELYSEKLERDELRNALAEETVSRSLASLCYYDGETEQVLTDAYPVEENGYNSNYTVFADEPIIVYSVASQAANVKVKLSEIEYAYDVETMVEEALNAGGEKQIAVQGAVATIEQTAAECFCFDMSGKNLYFVDDISEDDYHGNLYRMAVSKGGTSTPEVFDSDVQARTLAVYGEHLVYFKEMNSQYFGEGDLYVDGVLADYEVDSFYLDYIDETDTLIYFTDWDDDDAYGTLKVYCDETAVHIADEVHEFTATPDGEVLYLYDYSTEYMRGSLYLYDGEAERIDDDVEALIPTWSEGVRDSMLTNLMSAW